MKNVKIGVVEDEVIIADKICSTLIKLGYSVTSPAISYNRAVTMIEKEKPDLLLLDIQLAGNKTGIQLAQYIKENYLIPFIFLTANSDQKTIDEAAKLQPYAYLVKPFTSEELYAAIEIALSTFNERQQLSDKTAQGNEKLKDYLFIKDGTIFHKIYFNEIVYVQSEENYVVINTLDKRKIMTRSTFNDFLIQLDSRDFFRVHRSYSINLALIERIEQMDVIMKGGAVIPLGRTQREELMKLLDI